VIVVAEHVLAVFEDIMPFQFGQAVEDNAQGFAAGVHINGPDAVPGGGWGK
jgi:hypothetical protein